MLNGLGVALQRKRDLEGSIRAFRAALDVDPSNAEIADNLGVALRESGDMAAAKRWFLRAIELEPNNGRFLRHLADHEPFAPGDPFLDRLAQLFGGDEQLPTEQYIEGLFAYAKVLADVGQLEASLAVLQRANRLQRSRIVYDEAATLQSLELLKRSFSRTLAIGLRGCGEPSERPIFIVGMPRSGTTLIEAILASHPEVAAGGELSLFEEGIGSMSSVRNLDLYGLRNALKALGEKYMRSTDQFAGGARRLTDKMPFNFRFLPFIHAALPNARIIHVRRDPLDVAYSCFATFFVDNVPFSYDLAELGRYYAAYENLMATWRAVLPAAAMLEVTYEDIVTDLRGSSEKVLAFCGLAWDESVLRFHESRHAVRSASQTQVRRPLHASSVGRAAVLRDGLRPFVEELG